MSRPGSFIAMLLLFLGASSVSAQQRQLTGTVMAGEPGVPFAGAEVRLAGSRHAVCADANGDFALNVPADGEARLRITPVGYAAQEVIVAPGEETIEVALGDHVIILDEVRVVGYSTLLAGRASGNAVATLRSADLETAPAQRLEGAMQGKVVGALIQQNSGAPGSGYQIILRGVNTILGSAEPLIIVDGVVVSSAAVATGPNLVMRGSPSRESAGNRLSDINPADVERIEVLRGASASALYGSKAGNGVIVITTKRGNRRGSEDGRSGEAVRCFLPTLPR